VTQPSQLVLRFLASVGRPAEAELYLSLFRAERRESFAVIAVDRDVAGVAADALAVDLEFLSQLGLSPILAFDSAEQADAIAAWLAPDVRAEVVEASRAAQLARAGGIPLVPLAGDVAELASLCAALGTRKLVLLGADAGLSRSAQPLSIVDLTAEWDELSAPGTLSEAHAEILGRARVLIDAVPHAMTVSVTSPLDLLRELFTVRGAGTLIRRGATVNVYEGLGEIDRSRLAELIESSFARRLLPDFWHRPIERTYLAGDYRGAALIAATEQGAYLSKLAVGAPARGEGIARDLWRALCRDYPALFWRSRPDNPICSWYQEQCHGMVKLGPWHIYWRGLPGDRLAAAIETAYAAPLDFE
jgi:NAT, N-acetyltransferase, of N-acetylglutamate synthase